jgi:hypothetical protein
VPPAELEPLGWHAQDHVFAQQGSEGGYVAAVPCVDEPGHQLPFQVLQWPRGLVGVGGAQRGAGALQGAVDRGHAGVQQLGDLGGAEGEHLCLGRQLHGAPPVHRRGPGLLDHRLEMAMVEGMMTSAELLQIRDGEIVRGELIYDAEDLRRAMSQAPPPAG